MGVPIVTGVSPTPGLISEDGAVVVYVYENGTPILRTILSFEFPGMNLWEIAFNGDDFTPAYRDTSSRVAVVSGMYGNGFQYTLRRKPVWPDGPRLYPFVSNVAGQENA